MGEFDSPNWDDAPDMAADGRSLVPYPDPHPEFTTGVWERWKADRAARRGDKPSEEDDEETGSAFKDYYPPQITHEAEEFDDPCSTLATWVKRAVQAGWEIVELAHAQSISEGKPYGSGARAGEPRPTKQVDLQWLKVQKAGVGRALIVYPVVDGKPYSARVTRRFNGVVMSDAEMQRKLRGE